MTDTNALCDHIGRRLWESVFGDPERLSDASRESGAFLAHLRAYRKAYESDVEQQGADLVRIMHAAVLADRHNREQT
jgi:hypothetical protein